MMKRFVCLLLGMSVLFSFGGTVIAGLADGVVGYHSLDEDAKDTLNLNAGELDIGLANLGVTRNDDPVSNNTEYFAMVTDSNGISDDGSSHTVKVQLPSGNTLTLPFSSRRSSTSAYYLLWKSNVSPQDGAYVFTVTAADGRTATVTDEFESDPISPVDYQSIQVVEDGTAPKISWGPVSGAGGYGVNIYDSTGDLYYFTYWTKATSIKIRPGGLNPYSQYRCRVQAAREEGCSENRQNKSWSYLDRSKGTSFQTGAETTYPCEGLCYDDGSMSVVNQPWSNEIGSEIAVRFSPTSYPASLQKVQFFVGASKEPTTQFGIRIYDDDNGDYPGSRLDGGTLSAAAAMGNTWVEVDVSSENIVVNQGDFFVSMYWKKAPGSTGCFAQVLGNDKTSPIHSGTCWKWGTSGNWYLEKSDFTGYGNHMIRAELTSSPFTTAKVTGKITNTDTGEGLSEATVSFDQGEYVLTTASDGTFSSSVIPAGTYEVEISATNYYTNTLSKVTLSAGMTNDLSSALTPKSPEIVSTGANPDEVYNDGATTTLLTAKVTHPDGSGDISSVVVDLAQIGGSASQEMYDDGTHGDAVSGDGTYSYQTTVATATPIQQFSLNVTASDLYGFKAYANINLKVIKKIVATTQPEQVDTHTITNSLSNQTLVVSFKLDSLKTSKYGGFQGESECYVELTIYKPDGTVYGVYNVTESIDISIPNAEAGDWEFKTVNKCTVSVTYEIETKGSGTGMLVGRVTNAYTGLGIVGVTVTCNTGGSTVTLDDGYFSGVTVAGTDAAVTSTATGYHTNVQVDIAIMAGAATSLTIQMISDASAAQPVPSSQQLYVINEPKEDPDPLTQPFAAKELQGNLYLNALFPLYQEPVNIYVGVSPDIPGMAGKIFLFNKNNELVELTDTLYPWREGVTASQSSQILSCPLSLLPAFSCIFYSMVTTDPVSLSNYDLVSFTLSINQETTKADPAATGLFLNKMISGSALLY